MLHYSHHRLPLSPDTNLDHRRHNSDALFKNTPPPSTPPANDAFDKEPNCGRAVVSNMCPVHLFWVFFVTVKDLISLLFSTSLFNIHPKKLLSALYLPFGYVLTIFGLFAKSKDFISFSLCYQSWIATSASSSSIENYVPDRKVIISSKGHRLHS